MLFETLFGLMAANEIINSFSKKGKRRKSYNGPYVASNGKTYDRKETPYEYERRTKENQKKHEAYQRRKDIEEAQRRYERDLREQERKDREYRLERAKNNLIRAKNGYADDVGYVAKNGRVYNHKETREEYEERQIRKLEKEANRIRNKNK